MDWLIPVVIVAVLALCGIYLWASFNTLLHLNSRVDEAWADITTQLGRRSDLLPTLIETVKGYAPHEKAVFENLTRARVESLSASDPAEAGRAEGTLQQATRSVFAVAEAYPKLQADKDFLQLQQSLADIDDKIQASRRFYNGGAREMNAKIKVFPSSWFAKRRGYTERDFFEAVGGATVSEPPRIQF